MNNARIAENFMYMLQRFWVLKNKKSITQIIIWQVGQLHLELVDQEPDQQIKLQKVQLK